MSLNATAGSANANAYCDVTFADAYFDERLNSGDWASATTMNKEASIITATRALDKEEFVGYRASTTQALKFPRTGIVNEDSGVEYSSASVPDDIKRACCELALALLIDPEMFDGGLEDFANLGLGDESFTLRNVVAKYPRAVMQFLEPFLAQTNVRLVRG